jgi:hypothetical protein
VEISSECGNEHLSSVKCWETIEWLPISGLLINAELHGVSYLQYLKS